MIDIPVVENWNFPNVPSVFALNSPLSDKMKIFAHLPYLLGGLYPIEIST